MAATGSKTLVLLASLSSFRPYKWEKEVGVLCHNNQQLLSLGKNLHGDQMTPISAGARCICWPFIVIVSKARYRTRYYVE